MKKINIKSIRIDGGTQSRVALNQGAVADYADVLADGADMPPVVLFHDGADYWLADGFHRFFAYRGAGRASIPADVRAGSQRDAVLFACGANSVHGLRRTNDDKRKAVQTLLDDSEWAQWSDREIAKQCGVSHPFVAAVRSPYLVPERQQQNRDESSARRPEVVRQVEMDSTKAVKPAARAVEPEPEDYGPSAEEIAEAEASARDDAERVRLILDADDAAAALAEKCKQQAAHIRILESRIAGLTNACAEHVRSIKRLQRQAERAAA